LSAVESVENLLSDHVDLLAFSSFFHRVVSQLAVGRALLSYVVVAGSQDVDNLSIVKVVEAMRRRRIALSLGLWVNKT
jgi:hypothetical protein